ncbi:histone-lysine N-methyltransferase SETMAR isoform X1 [Drosophila navojoa]|uniref:histone-lysine N-methyltransferase SETMAR isoform X1 n=2 Tax=Drosophila navojoa TaxID=7232 RepID=UPI0011BFCC9F|nr:histone-lysine N-methyltransferase SETMAR isoform X1 [Drosophila navojoa]
MKMAALIEIEDDYDHMENVEYILENVLMPDDGSPEFRHLQDDYNSHLTLSCKCSNNKNCCNNIDFCHKGGLKYMRVEDELVVIPSESQQFRSIIECNELCECQISQCLNRRVQYGPRQKLEVFESSLYKSKGLRTTAYIPRGAFICEYAGELLTPSEAQRRIKIIDESCQMNYILCLYEHSKTRLITIVDPSKRGNIGRYLNHSCQPNCKILPVRTNCPIPKIGIFAKRDIFANEELCFHYAGEDNYNGMLNGKPCLCGSIHCNGFIPNTEI